MLAAISTGHFIGSAVEHALLILGGAYIAFFWPVRFERDIRAETSEQVDAILKKLRPLLGYLLMLVGLAWIVSDWLRYRS